MQINDNLNRSVRTLPESEGSIADVTSTAAQAVARFDPVI